MYKLWFWKCKACVCFLYIADSLLNIFIGAPPKEFLEQPITSSDHPFLRANVESIKHHNMKKIAAKGMATVVYLKLRTL